MRGVSLAQTQATLAEYFLDAGNDQRAALPLLADGFGRCPGAPSRHLPQRLPRPPARGPGHGFRAHLGLPRRPGIPQPWPGATSNPHLSTRSNLRDYGEGFPPARLGTPGRSRGRRVGLDGLESPSRLRRPDVPGCYRKNLHSFPIKTGKPLDSPFSLASISPSSTGTSSKSGMPRPGAVPPPARRLERPVAYVFWRKGTAEPLPFAGRSRAPRVDGATRSASFAQACECSPTTSRKPSPGWPLAPALDR